MGLEINIRQLDLKPNSVLLINVDRLEALEVGAVDKLTPRELPQIRLPYAGYAVPIVFTVGSPEVNMLTRAQLEQALAALGAQTTTEDWKLKEHGRG